ncbi:MAG: hypothetical protein L6Q92_16450 [Phycisphaerae bacterium]|nr:hypothetical protein [Phycisphaerae bacterium]
MSSGLFEGLTRDLRQEVMQTGVIGGYRLNAGEWDERFRIEASRPSCDGVPVRSRIDAAQAQNEEAMRELHGCRATGNWFTRFEGLRVVDRL